VTLFGQFVRRFQPRPAVGVALIALLLAVGVNTMAISSWAGVPEPTPEQYEYLLPAGLPLRVVLQDKINTETAVEGQPISAWVSQDIFVGTRKLLSKDDRVLGTVRHIEKPIEGRNALMIIGFDQLVLSDGISLPMTVSVQTQNDKAYFGGELTPGTKPEIVKYNIWRIGTYGRVVYRGKREMGSHIEMRPGDILYLTLKEPVVLYPF
jgi:hypothetical protein